MGVAEIDDAKTATTARTIAQEKRIVYEDVIWDQINLKGYDVGNQPFLFDYGVLEMTKPPTLRVPSVINTRRAHCAIRLADQLISNKRSKILKMTRLRLTKHTKPSFRAIGARIIYIAEPGTSLGGVGAIVNGH
ncbi:hypothetical protein BDR05DRAFT_950555 [Suillus weaverae]|nr:hypothetical protein BDR05DRAFT_950555 [Suillus weaverae]